MKIIAERWHALPTEQKKAYENLAEIDKQRH
jgi:hypothetical protein